MLYVEYCYHARMQEIKLNVQYPGMLEAVCVLRKQPGAFRRLPGHLPTSSLYFVMLLLPPLPALRPVIMRPPREVIVSRMSAMPYPGQKYVSNRAELIPAHPSPPFP